ncbi:MAG: glycosyltransferase family 2 protein [Candidatus Zixiibacteriota bacterium]
MTHPSPFTIAVVMPVRNEERFIGKTLDQLRQQEYPLDKVEVIIADGDSSDNTREIAKGFASRFGSLRVLNNAGMLPSSGRNVGVRQSSAPYILILDGHCHIPGNKLLDDMVRLFESTGAGCLCRPQPLDPPDISSFQRAVAICRNSTLGHKPGSEIYADFEGEVDPTSSGAMYRREVFDIVGYFDESFDACEDVELNHRVKEAGIKSILSPLLKIYYYPRENLRGLWKQMRRYGRGRFNYSAKHRIFSPIQWFSGAAAAGLALGIVLSIFSTLFCWLTMLATLGYLLLVSAFSIQLYREKKELGLLLFGPSIFAAVHFGLGVGFLEGLMGRVWPGRR